MPPRPLPRLTAPPKPRPLDPDAELPVALTVHKALVAYIAGEADWRGLTVPEAVLVVYRTFRDDPKAAAENADMLADFDPVNNPLTADDVAAIEEAVRRIREVDRRLLLDRIPR